MNERTRYTFLAWQASELTSQFLLTIQFKSRSQKRHRRLFSPQGRKPQTSMQALFGWLYHHRTMPQKMPREVSSGHRRSAEAED